MNIGSRLDTFSVTVHIVFLIAITLTLFLLLACGKPASENTSQTNDNLPPSEITPPTHTQTTAWNADSILSSGEYSGKNTYAGGNYEIQWRTDDTFIYLGIKAKTTGWVAVGLNAADRMKNADLVFGYVVDNKATISDQFSTGINGPHQPDIQLGGEQNIDVFGGSEEGGYTTIEFKRLLDTGDNFDSRLISGTIPIIWSYGSSDNITIQHVNRGYGEINL